jgi:hypothetical protein
MARVKTVRCVKTDLEPPCNQLPEQGLYVGLGLHEEGVIVKGKIMDTQAAEVFDLLDDIFRRTPAVWTRKQR